MTLPVHAGDIFVTSWGYEQTNVEFYEVVRATEKTVWLVEIESLKEPTGYMTENVLPKKGDYKGEVFRRRLQDWAGPHTAGVRINDVADARLWDGKAKYASHYA